MHYTNMCPSSRYVSLLFSELGQIYYGKNGQPLVSRDQLNWLMINQIH
jgi:hypothetical protein